MLSTEYFGPIWEWASESWRNKVVACLGAMAVVSLPLFAKGCVEGIDHPHGRGAQECTVEVINPTSWIGCPAFAVGMEAGRIFIDAATAIGDNASVVNPQT